MGTRHLIAVQVDGEYKVAQYGQWDGYPEGQGVSILNFLRQLDGRQGLKAFAAAVRRCWFVDGNEVDRLRANGGEASNPQFSRNTSADLLPMILGAEDGLPLYSDLEFAGDSLFCEWAYVIDLDENILEVFEGFNKEPLAAWERFVNVPRDHEEYYQVRRVATYPLGALPMPDEFVAAFIKKE